MAVNMSFENLRLGLTYSSDMAVLTFHHERIIITTE